MSPRSITKMSRSRSRTAGRLMSSSASGNQIKSANKPPWKYSSRGFIPAEPVSQIKTQGSPRQKSTNNRGASVLSQNSDFADFTAAGNQSSQKSF